MSAQTEKCPYCKSKNVEFIDKFLISDHGMCNIYQCNTCGLQHVVDNKGNIVGDA